MKKNWAEDLAGIDLFGGLSASGREDLVHGARKIEAGRGDEVLGAGDPPEWVLAVIAGQFKVFREPDGGPSLIAGFLGPGDVFGEDAVLLGRDYDLTAAALDKSTALLLPAAGFLKVLENHPRFGRVLAAASAARCRTLRERLQEISSLAVAPRLARALFRLARRFGGKNPYGAAIELRVTHRELGEFIGASRENVSLALSRLKKQGVIATAGRRIVVLDRAGLKKALE